MATAQPIVTGGIPPTKVPGPLPQLMPPQQASYDAGMAVNDPRNANGATGDPNITLNNGVAIGTVNPNQLAGNQLANLMNSNSPLNQLALAQGQAQAAATGNANGTLMAGAAQTALDQQLTPYAMQQADAYQKQQAQNEDAINQLQNTRTSVHGNIMAAGVSANASMHNAQLQADIANKTLQQNHDEFLTNWGNQFKMATQSQAFQKASQQAQNDFTAKFGAMNTAYQTVMSDPDYWSNPQAAMGMVNYFSQNMGSLFDSLGIGGVPAQPNPNIPNAAP